MARGADRTSSHFGVIFAPAGRPRPGIYVIFWCLAQTRYGKCVERRGRSREPACGRTPAGSRNLWDAHFRAKARLPSRAAAPDCRCYGAGAQVWSEPIWPGPLGQASPKDQTKSRRIQASDGSGRGAPTGGVVIAASKLMPSVPSLLTEETA